MAAPVHTKETQISIGDGASPEVFTPIAKVMAVPPLTQEKPEIDVTTLDSTAREYIAGLAVGSDLEFEMIWDKADAGQVAVGVAYAAGTRSNFQIDFPDFTRAAFAGIVRSFGPNANIDDAIKGSFMVKVSGDVVFSTWTP